VNVSDYKKFAIEYGYDEDEIFTGHPESYLKDFILFQNADIDLKIYLGELIVYRHFMSAGAIILPNDLEWFITEFFSQFEGDFFEPWRTESILAAKDMIMSRDIFGKSTVGTVFMFAIIEFCAKYKLGFRPHKYDYFDSERYSYIKNTFPSKKTKQLYIRDAIDLLEKQHYLISKSLERINRKVITQMEDLNIAEKRFTRHKISDRLSIARNLMMHGELFSFFDKGMYMLMIYILFQLNEQKETQK
jgi:hypothetical protein